MARSKARLSNYTLPTPFTQTGTEQQANNALKMERLLRPMDARVVLPVAVVVPWLLLFFLFLKKLRRRDSRGPAPRCLPLCHLPTSSSLLQPFFSEGLMKVSGDVTGRE